MKNEVRRIADAAWAIVSDPRANRFERIEALKLVAACRGLLLPDISEQFLSVKQVCQLRAARKELVQKALRKKERRKYANRRAYLRKKIAQAQEATPTPTPTPTQQEEQNGAVN